MRSYLEKIYEIIIFNIYRFLTNNKYIAIYFVLKISSASFELNSLAANSEKWV